MNILRFLILMLLASQTLAYNNPLKIMRITPSGDDVYNQRQIVFTFNQPVVPLGRMERKASEIPISIIPAVDCQWRWLNTTSLACQLGDDTALKSATRYSINVSPGIMTESLQTMEHDKYHEFVTRRPQVTYASVESWLAPGMPKLRVYFNQAVYLDSVAKHLYFQTPERIAAKVELPIISEDDAEEYKPLSPTLSKVWIVSPTTLLALNRSVDLMVEPDIKSGVGSELGVEQDRVVNFHTFPKFKFLGIECRSLNDESVSIAPKQRINWNRCDPLKNVYLKFSSPVIKEVVKENLLVMPDLANGRSDYDPWGTSRGYSHLNSAYYKDSTYKISLPIPLKAYQTYHLYANNLNFKDEFGRNLPAPLNIKFATDNRAPRHVFEHELSVLEKDIDSDVPIFITNLNKLYIYYHKLTTAGWSSEQYKGLYLPTVRNLSFKTPLGIRDLLDESTGIVQGYFKTSPNINNKDAQKENWFLSQVTPFHIQAKVGYHNTLVWVTDFANGLPVKNAIVSIRLDNYAPDSINKSLTSVITDKNGMAWLPGTKELDPKLKYADVYGADKQEPRFFIQAEKNQEIALLPLDSQFRVYVSQLTDYNIYAYQRQKYGHIHTWGTTAQGIYKVGDTVQYKLFVRDQSNKQFVAAPADGYSLQIIDPTGKVAHEVKDFSLSEFGAYDGEFTISKAATVGWYQFKLTAKFKEKQAWYPLRVLVSDFTPSSFKVRTELNGELFHVAEKVEVNTAASLHAGGPYVNAQTKIRATLKPIALHSQDFQFDVLNGDEDTETVYSVEDRWIDDKGELQTSFTLPEKSEVLYGKLTVESAVRDDRGKHIANSATASYVGRDRFVGLKEKSWLLTAKETAEVLLLVVDEYTKPVSGTDINVKIEYQVTKAARVKGAGNAYLTRYEHQWVETDTCRLKSENAPITCSFTPDKAGAYKITATIKDTKDRTHSTELYQWAAGEDFVMWETSADNSLEIVAEQEDYKVGDIARYFVKNPYPGAKALITIERFGTLKTWVQTLESSMEVIEVPIIPDYVPGFFVSVTIMSPRVAKPIDSNQVDLGKPAFRMGYLKTEVKDTYKELVVGIETDKPVYKPGEEVTIDLQAQPRHPEMAGEPIELAVTVLDESVFDLLKDGRKAFDPYKGFYDLDSLDMANFSLLMRLVGRQKFEKKGANVGGDGAASNLSMRSVFKFVSYWNPSIKTDANGKAQIKFTVPDNLTGWRVLAMAVTPTDKMGLTDANFKVNKPIEIRSALPNQILTGDSFDARFTVMNRTNRMREIMLTLQAKGPVVISNDSGDLLRRTYMVKAQPYKRYMKWLPLKANKSGEIEFTVTASDDEENDAIIKTLTINKRRPSMTVATYGSSIQSSVTESIQIPNNIHTDVGGLSVTTSASVIGGVDSAFQYMRDYPYTCWEQKLTKGTMASHYNQLQAYVSNSWKNSNKLPTEMIELAKEYQAPNGGMTYYIPKDQHVSPYLSAYTALAFNWLAEAGYTIPETVQNKLHEYLLTLLRKNVMPDFYSKGMASTTRAVALAALAKHHKITIRDIRRYQRHVRRMDLFGKSQFLAAALEVPGTGRIRTSVVNMILAHANQTAGKVSFTENLETGYKRILSSSVRTQCSILSSLSSYHARMKHWSNVGDIPFKIVRNIKGKWKNTQESMFCMNALTEYAKAYETDKPSMTIQTWLDAEKLGETTFDDVKNPAKSFKHDMDLNDPGTRARVKLKRQGQGRMYYTVRLKYAEKAETSYAVNAGIEVKRQYHVERDGKWIELTTPMEIKTGELVKVDIKVSTPAPRYFVVVDDAVPGGLEPVNRDLATSSDIKVENNSWNFYHQELRHHAVRFYSDYLPAGNYHLSYVAQAIAPGEFNIMPTHAEEMYEPDVFGNTESGKLIVKR
jgi:uncharacterized protein YfaS (alpha-2-macroglobulin family)